MFTSILLAIWAVLVQSAPWLLFGFLIAGIIHVLLPVTFVRSQFRKPGAVSVLKSTLFGIPLPLCSCSVIPVGVSLRRAGASKGATASFFVSTPEIGVDSFLLSYGLLGPLVAIARVITSFISAFVLGVLVDMFSSDEDVAHSVGLDESESCCHGMSEGVAERRQNGGPLSVLRNIVTYGFVTLVEDLAVVLTAGIILAGVISTLVPADFFENIALGQWESIFLMLVVSFPLYVCATSSTPIAAALMLKGLAPAAVMVFLLAGPASNISTILAIRRELGTRVVALYLVVVASFSVIAGIFLEYFFRAELQQGVKALGQTASGLSAHSHITGFWNVAMGGLLLLLLLRGFAVKISERHKKVRSCCNH